MGTLRDITHIGAYFLASIGLAKIKYRPRHTVQKALQVLRRQYFYRLIICQTIKPQHFFVSTSAPVIPIKVINWYWFPEHPLVPQQLPLELK